MSKTVDENCEHKFVFIKNESFFKRVGYNSKEYTSIDFFFCEKCLMNQEKKREAHINPGYEHTKPDWCKTINTEIYE